MQRVLPGESDAAEHLDRPLAGGDCRVAGVALGGGDGDRCFFVVLGHAPRCPVRERARELTFDVGVRERMRHRLVHADCAPELLARLRVLDRELQCALRDAGRLERERRKTFVFWRAVVEELLATVRTARLFEEHRAVEKAQLRKLIAAPASVREHVARLAAQQLLVLGERELH